MTETFGLAPKRIELLQTLFAQFKKIQTGILYGSRAMGNYKEGSDIDITLVAPEMTLTEFLDLENKIDDLMLAYKVDLSLHHRIENPALLEHIKKHGVKFYQASPPPAAVS